LAVLTVVIYCQEQLNFTDFLVEFKTGIFFIIGNIAIKWASEKEARTK